MAIKKYLITESMDVILKGCEIMMQIGIHPHELHVKQRVIVDVQLTVDIPTVWNDQIESVHDYDYVRIGITEAANKIYNLQETFCKEILMMCISNTTVSSAFVYVRKVDIYSDCDSVGVRMSANRK